MAFASMALAATMVDLGRDLKAVAAMREELTKSTAGIACKGYIPEEVPKVPYSRTPQLKFPDVRVMCDDIKSDVTRHRK